MRKPWRPTWLVYLAVVLASLACSLPAMSTSATATAALPSATPIPTITPTPTPLPAERLDEAEQARFYGDWERALTLYEAIRMQSSDLSVQQEAAYGIALTYSQDLRFPEAIQELSVLISQAEDLELRARAYYLRAAARIEIGEYLSAAEDYQGYLEIRSGVMDEAVSELRGDALFAGGDYAAAQAAYQAALLAVGDALQPALEIKLARSYAAGDDPATALALYNSLYARVDDPYTLATLDYLMGLAYTELGDLDRAYARYLDAVTNFPDAYDSYAGLVLLVEAGVPVDEFQRGLVDYYAGQYGVAIAAFDRFLAAGGGDLRPEVHYYRGLANRAAGDYYGALNDWETLITFYPESYFWDDAWEE
ncbi:MAG: tetratricopeptide repeat protein, partial [Anaerolineales bacterium]|nr:tetratricopeptide repeat protein [Anaerolineales bacterium]